MLWFIGWDTREAAAYDVCVSSLRRHASIPLDIRPLKHRQLRKNKLFWREWRVDWSGQYWDIADGRPFSTEFSHTRFLVPELARDSEEEWAFFCDADFVFAENPAKLFVEVDRSKALMVVKHRHEPTNTSKMDGVRQTPYPRKNWSSFVAWNLRHPGNLRLPCEAANTADGSYLHSFGWLDDADIGELNPGWNWLVGHSSPEIKPLAYHFTDGGPWFEDWAGGPCDEVWLRAAE